MCNGTFSRRTDWPAVIQLLFSLCLCCAAIGGVRSAYVRNGSRPEVSTEEEDAFCSDGGGDGGSDGEEEETSSRDQDSKAKMKRRERNENSTLRVAIHPRVKKDCSEIRVSFSFMY